MKTYAIDGTQLAATIEKACATALDGGREICGLIYSEFGRLRLREVRNKAKRGGSFALYVTEVREVVEEIEYSGGIVVGTFHSHPLGLANPGETDIAQAVDDSLMLIIDCMDKVALLWWIRNGRARKVGLDLIERPQRRKGQMSRTIASTVRRTRVTATAYALAAPRVPVRFAAGEA